MANEALPQAIRDFLRTRVSSVRQLETLLMLRGTASTWTAARLGAELRIGTRWTEEQLEGLRSCGLVVEDRDDSGLPGYRYAPTTEELAGMVEDLARLFVTRRTSVIRAIFEDADEDTLRVFSDAFRLRPKDG